MRVTGKETQVFLYVIVQLHVALIAVEGVGLQDDVVVGHCAAVGARQVRLPVAVIAFHDSRGIGDDGRRGNTGMSGIRWWQVLRAAVGCLQGGTTLTQANTERGG